MEQDFRIDSPTCTREGVRLALSIIASMSWKLNLIDVKTAFLQGSSLQREVLVKPPKEANADCLWKLNKCIYGLAYASRYWYLKLLDSKPFSLDQGIFVWSNGDQIIAIAVCFVDDILWGGDSTFGAVINKLKSIFHIGAERDSSFEYLRTPISPLKPIKMTLSNILRI